MHKLFDHTIHTSQNRNTDVCKTFDHAIHTSQNRNTDVRKTFDHIIHASQNRNMCPSLLITQFTPVKTKILMCTNLLITQFTPVKTETLMCTNLSVSPFAQLQQKSTAQPRHKYSHQESDCDINKNQTISKTRHRPMPLSQPHSIFYSTYHFFCRASNFNTLKTLTRYYIL